MSRPDPAASAALAAEHIRPVFFAYLDVVGDPVRANTSGRTINFPAGLGLPGLEGQSFDGINPAVVDVSPVRIKEGGSEAVTAKLSGIVALDDEMLNTIGNPANWQGRVAQLWRMIRDTTGTQQGAIQHYYTGYMVALTVSGSPEEQTIELTIESYLAAFSQASNRTYLDQESFDPGDLSARAAIAIANGVSGNPLTDNVGTGGGVDGGGVDYVMRNLKAMW